MNQWWEKNDHKTECPRSVVMEKVHLTGGSNLQPMDYKCDALSIQLIGQALLVNKWKRQNTISGHGTLNCLEALYM